MVTVEEIQKPAEELEPSFQNVSCLLEPLSVYKYPL